MESSEFDEQFQKKLTETIMTDRLSMEICAALHVNNETPLIKSNSIRESIYKFNRVSLKLLCDFNRVNVLGDTGIARSTLTFREKLNRILYDRTKRSIKSWPWLVLVVYLICASALLLITYFQYIYDANTAKLERLEAHLIDANERDRLVNELHLNVTKLERDFTLRAEAAYGRLKLVGGAFIGWSFMIESLVVLLWHTLDWLLLVPLYHYVGNWVWFAAKAILDQNDERRMRMRLTMEELRHFAVDSMSYSRVKLEQYCSDLVDAFQEQEGLIVKNEFDSLTQGAMQARRKLLTQQHRRNLEQLKYLALKGRLNPLNRTAAGRDKLALVYFLTFIGYNLYSHLLIISLYVSLTIYFSAQGRPIIWATSSDIWNVACLAIVYEIGLIAAAFLATVSVVTVLDQLETINSLRSLIIHVIKANESRFQEMMREPIKSSTNRNILNGCHACIIRIEHEPNHHNNNNNNEPSQSRRKLLARNIELDLITIIVQYRLAEATFLLSKGLLTNNTRTIIHFAISIPIVLCIHSAYYDRGLKLVSLGSSLATTACCLTLLAPLGLLYKRSVRTLGAIWVLVAQLSYYETVPVINKSLQLDSSVSLFILRRLIGDMQFTVDKFTIRWLTMPITYANLIRILSWIFLFIMAGSILSVRLFGDGLGSIMSDPFGLYKFLKDNPMV